MRLKRLQLTLICAILAFILAGCGNNTEADETIVLTLGVYGQRTIPIVSQFNLSQDEYRIELVDYSQDGSRTRSAALQRLGAELASGEGPDLIYLWNMQMDVDVYGPKGYLEDLYPYLDADESISRDDLVTAFLDAYEVDGKLYGAVSGFSVITMFGAHSELDEIEVWDFNAMQTLAEQHGGVSELLSTRYTKLSFLESALTLAAGDYINFSTGTAMFDSEDYKELLLFCNQLDADYSNTQPEDPALTFYVLSSFQELQYYEALYEDAITFVGYPTSNGSGHCFTNVSDQFGMNANSENKDGAWQFLRLLLSESYQTDTYVDSGFAQFPTNLAAMQALIEAETTTEYTTDENGQIQEVPKRGNQEDFTYHAATEAHVEQVLALIEETDQVSSATNTLVEIAEEEAGNFFSGTATVDEAAERTQDRATTYLDERN